MKLFGKTISISLLVLLVVASTLTFRMFNKHIWSTPEKVIAWDVISYYAYLPATFIEHDLTLSFTDHEHVGTYWPETLPDGRKVIKTTMGMSIMYSPFFLAMHIAAPALGNEANGFTVPYAFALTLAGLFYTILGLFLLRKVLLRHFPEWITSIVLVILIFGTNLYWYSLYEPPMSHAFSFCLFALFALLTELWHEKPSVWRSVAVGLTIGIISLVRPSNILVGVYFALYGVRSKETINNKCRIFKDSWCKIVLMAMAAVLVWIPQMVYWFVNTGQLFFYSYGDNERFFFGNPKIVEGIFGFRKGWLVYTPVMSFALMGLLPLYRHHRNLFWAISVFFVLNVYVVFSWWCWWYGGSRGMRAMIECQALMVIPLAAWIEWLAGCKPVLRSIMVVILSAITMLSAFHNLRYIH